MLDGRMMQFPLTLGHFLARARTFFPEREIVTRESDGALHRYRYREFFARTAQLARALDRLGCKPGDRVATLCWNHRRHLEAYFAAPVSGRVMHTLNLRLHPSEIGYIARHAGDSVVIVDRSLLPLFEKFRADVPTIEHVIVVPDDGPVPEGKGYLDYDALLAREAEDYPWPALDENAAAMICYTSGTTGNPKGVVYSHRSIVLHTLVACMADALGVRESDTILPVVPMFHAAAWGLPFTAIAVGAKLVFPGPKLDPASLVDLMVRERVTLAAGVPTIWLGILALLDDAPKAHDLSAIRCMLIGGAAAPPAMIDGFDRRHGLQVLHAWGMTEMSPLGTIARVKSTLELDDAARLSTRASQGMPVSFVEQRHVDEAGAILPWDGTSMGELEVRGPWVAASYVGDEGQDRWAADGWFKTGDVVTLDAEGYVRITDRSKDVIKSGGEWISSVALENALMSHPAVLEAAVFAGAHERWGERPIAAVVWKQGKSATFDELRAHLAAQFAKLWIPDDFVVVDQVPRTSTGKFLKTKLRALYGDRLLTKKA
ncbi:MAG: 3-(methylthio)propionyl-CoA ligase [Polyangiales bacterium]